jgi:hypothetical protein
MVVSLVLEKYDAGFRFYYAETELVPNPLGISKRSFYVKHNDRRPDTFFVVREIQNPVTDKDGTVKSVVRVPERAELFPYKRFGVRDLCELFIKVILMYDIANELSFEDFDVEGVTVTYHCRDVCWGFTSCSFNNIIGLPMRDGEVLVGCLREGPGRAGKGNR